MNQYSVKGRGARARRKPRPKPIPRVENDHPGWLIAYTDGSTFRGNPAPISWAVVYTRDGVAAPDPWNPDRNWELVGAGRVGSNNRAELMAICWALEHQLAEDLIVRTDSTVMLNCCLGYRLTRGNHDLWTRFQRAMATRERRKLQTIFEHVKGHRGHPFNQRADQLASRHAQHNARLLTDDESIP